jgi:hypothetical protein
MLAGVLLLAHGRNPNSSQISSIWSKSSRWLIVTIRPRFLNALATICVADTSISSDELRHRQELVDADGRRLLGRARAALRLALDAAGRLLTPMPTLLAARLQLVMTRAMFSCTAS